MAESSATGGRRGKTKETETMEEMMDRLDLTEKERTKLVVDDEEDQREDELHALIGKVLHRKVLHVNTIGEALRPAWGNPRELNFRPLGENVFVASFMKKRDSDLIFDGGPWMVGKHCVVLERFNIRPRPSELKFEKIKIWVRVINLPFNLLCPPWPKRIAAMVGEVITLNADDKGFAFGDCLRIRAWIRVDEPLMRWVQLEKARTKETEFFDIQYENLPYFCFSCGLLGHGELLCPTLAGRDEYGRPPYREALRKRQNEESESSGSIDDSRDSKKKKEDEKAAKSVAEAVQQPHGSQ
ncbi:uncharacterized protein [Aegilops tauschii subsp. strangulata]|uniref:uncharacterized protein n=1 Tax=Aegilops tauschii subsp. strangulata TaxID=200361 RepID=UPI001ABCA882|nr:uncharacterized protein LOC120963579 [Aegilops tauschii subsp. strangulata]